MGTMLNAFKGLTSRQIAVLVVVLLGSAGAIYGAYALISDSGGSGLDEGQQLIPVQYGNLVNQVSTNGSLVFPIRETLTFGTQGTVGDVLVEEGQQVEEGQLLVSLDAATLASVEKAVAQARVKLQDAEDALAEAQDPHTLLDLVQAEALSLSNAQEALDGVLQPAEEDIIRAELAVISAELSLKNARVALDKVVNWPTEKEVATAQSQVDSAITSLAATQGDLDLTKSQWEDKVQTAQDALDAALNSYKGVFKKWLGIDVNEEELNLTPDTLLSSWGVDLASLFAPNLRFQDVDLSFLAKGPPADDPATPWNEGTVYNWLNFYPGAIVVTCEDGVVPKQGVCIVKQMDDAWTAYQNGKANLDTAQIQAATAIATADAAIIRAEDSLVAAQDALTDMAAGSDPLEIKSKEKQFALAQIALAKAEEELAKLLDDPDPLEVQAKENQVAIAQSRLDEAEETLAALLGSSVDSFEIIIRKAEVVAAQTALEATLQRLESTTLTAPIAGVVSLINVEVGQTVNANTVVVEIVDPTVIEIAGIVDEIDVLFVSLEAQANVTMDALPGQVLQGTVSSIASAAQSQQGVVSYPISIRVQVPEGVQLREGLSATANIVIREENNVLLVPLQSLYGTFEQPLVQVMNNGNIEDRLVVLGSSDDFWVAVRQGLAVGDQVVMETTQATTSQFGGVAGNFRQFLGQTQMPGAIPGFQQGQGRPQR
ncbi:MAG: efflux RND transporter periplasmic adaptor subunit [Chloroflexota bacterium]